MQRDDVVPGVQRHVAISHPASWRCFGFFLHRRYYGMMEDKLLIRPASVPMKSKFAIVRITPKDTATLQSYCCAGRKTSVNWRKASRFCGGIDTAGVPLKLRSLATCLRTNNRQQLPSLLSITSLVTVTNEPSAWTLTLSHTFHTATNGC
ncbi:hypothetical protein TRVL_06083 [Trypanosoma vivax]|nr:hypothetical protein TRVL_06083 [Trypanosoma vivax]